MTSVEEEAEAAEKSGCVPAQPRTLGLIKTHRIKTVE